MMRRSPKVRGIRIVRTYRINGSHATQPADDPPTYWNESRGDWTPGDGTHYKTLGAAQDAIKRFKLTDGSPVL